MTPTEIEKYGDNAAIIDEFRTYLNKRLGSETTPPQYINWVFKIQNWFIENNICDKDFDIWKKTNLIEEINSKLNNEYKEIWKNSNKQEKNWYSSPWNSWVEFNYKNKIKNIPFSINEFKKNIDKSNLFLSKKFIVRFSASLLTKPFVILTGLSGSGKTKLAQAFAMWICENKSQYCIVAVGADWTNREPLLGFPNALEEGKYVKPDNKVLDLIVNANNDETKPYFLILDEMNLSHVERYFADFLSVMESNGKISLHSGPESWKDVPKELALPKNLFIVGTVNIDETTYMFSPKVLDRANVIEFRVTADEMESYLVSTKTLDLDSLKSSGANMADSFVQIACNRSLQPNNIKELETPLLNFFKELKKTGAEFGYRNAAEIIRFSAVVNHIEPDWTPTDIIDAAIMQKLLPKVHGSRRKMEPVLKTLAALCINNSQKIDDLISSKTEIDYTSKNIIYPISLEKILRMYYGLIDNGFTSYAEA